MKQLHTPRAREKPLTSPPQGRARKKLLKHYTARHWQNAQPGHQRFRHNDYVCQRSSAGAFSNRSPDDSRGGKQRSVRAERILLLSHMIASHHGTLDFGAVVSPAIPEASVLHEIDMLDSRMNMYEETYKGQEP